MKKIIILSGKQYSGKDTAAKILLEYLKDYKRIGIGDAIKLEYGKQNNLTYEQIEKEKHLYRDGLIKLGNHGRSIDSDFWLKKIIDSPDNVVVPDIRVKHELELFEAVNALTIRVNASRQIRQTRGVLTSEDDITECDLDNVDNWDFIIDNDGSYEDLVEKCKKIIPEIEKKLN